KQAKRKKCRIIITIEITGFPLRNTPFFWRGKPTRRGENYAEGWRYHDSGTAGGEAGTDRGGGQPVDDGEKDRESACGGKGETGWDYYLPGSAPLASGTPGGRRDD